MSRYVQKTMSVDGGTLAVSYNPNTGTYNSSYEFPSGNITIRGQTFGFDNPQNLRFAYSASTRYDFDGIIINDKSSSDPRDAAAYRDIDNITSKAISLAKQIAAEIAAEDQAALKKKLDEEKKLATPASTPTVPATSSVTNSTTQTSSQSPGNNIAKDDESSPNLTEPDSKKISSPDTNKTKPIDAGSPASPPTQKSTNDDTPQDTSDTGYPNEKFIDIAPSEPKLVKPGVGLKNPLGYLSSYTYQLSLYLVTPAAYDQFVLSGRKDIGAVSPLPKAQ